jgi:hypothetical protein
LLQVPVVGSGAEAVAQGQPKTGLVHAHHAWDEGIHDQIAVRKPDARNLVADPPHQAAHHAFERGVVLEAGKNKSHTTLSIPIPIPTNSNEMIIGIFQTKPEMELQLHAAQVRGRFLGSACFSVLLRLLRLAEAEGLAGLAALTDLFPPFPRCWPWVLPCPLPWVPSLA